MLSENKLQKELWINKTYRDTQAAMDILKTPEKPELKELPMLKYLFIGANNEGFWNLYHMSMHLRMSWTARWSYIQDSSLLFLFDHSHGHACKQHGALNAQQMSQNNGETHPIMRDTTIMSTTGYLGPHLPCLLDARQVQSFVYKAEDLGPWYLSPKQRELQRHNKPTGRHRAVE